MAGIIEINGGIQRLQDYAPMKQQEDMKPGMQQQNMVMRQEEQVQNKSIAVHAKDDTENYTPGYDAKEKGNGSYQGDGGRRRKKAPADGTVTLKKSGGFDIKI